MVEIAERNLMFGRNQLVSWFEDRLNKGSAFYLTLAGSHDKYPEAWFILDGKELRIVQIRYDPSLMRSASFVWIGKFYEFANHVRWMYSRSNTKARHAVISFLRNWPPGTIKYWGESGSNDPDGVLKALKYIGWPEEHLPALEEG